MSRRRPVVVRTRHKSTQISRSLRHRVLYQYLPHAIITTGEAIRNELIAEQQVNPDRIVSIPTGVDLQMYRPTLPDPTLRAGFGLSGNQVLVGTIAFLRSYKGLDYLLEAARMLTRSCPDVRFLIVGDGPEAERLKRTINQLNLEECVFLAGYRKDIHRVLASMDIFVLPSVEGEGLSQSLTQAMAMECPVVATDVGSVREVVQHRVTGLLTKPKDAAALAEQIMVLLEDPPFGAKMAQMARALVEESYSLQRMITQTEEFYVRLLSE